MRCVERDPRNTPLRRLDRIIFSVADYRMAKRRKLHPNLILQSRHQSDSDERSRPKPPFDAIAKFGASSSRVAPRAQFLKHSLLPKVVDEHPFLSAEMSAHNRKILSLWSMRAKLLHQRIPVPPRLGKEQNSRRVTVDAMNNKRPLPLQLQFLSKE